MNVTIIISILNLVLAAMVFYFARKHETQETGIRSGELIVEIKTICRDVSELKSDVQAMRTEWQSDHDNLVGLIREMSAMWRIVDRLQAGGEANDKYQYDC